MCWAGVDGLCCWEGIQARTSWCNSEDQSALSWMFSCGPGTTCCVMRLLSSVSNLLYGSEGLECKFVRVAVIRTQIFVGIKHGLMF